MIRTTNAGKGRAWRFLPALVAVCTLATFILSEWTVLHRAFGNDQMPYLIGLSAVVICAYARASWEPPLRGAIRAALASWAGSVAGYLMTLVSFYAEHQRLTSGVDLHVWLLGMGLPRHGRMEPWPRADDLIACRRDLRRVTGGAGIAFNLKPKTPSGMFRSLICGGIARPTAMFSPY